MSARSTIAEIDAIVAGSTVPRRFLELAASDRSLPLFHSMLDGGGWHVRTTGDVEQTVARVAAGLQHDGVGPGDRVLLMMRNRPEFHSYDLAVQFLRATPVSIYNSSSPEEVQYLASHAGAAVAVVEDVGFLERILKVRDQLPMLRQIYVLDAPAEALPSGVAAASELESRGSADLADLAATTEPGDLATLIYTSGTTGPPKGVMISQYNVVYTVEQLRECLDLDGYTDKRVVSYLPMAHIAERMTSHYQPLLVGISVYCCPDAGQLANHLKEVHPQIIFGVPRVFEKIYNGVNAALAADPARKSQFDDGVAAAIEIKRAQRAGTATQEQLDTWAFLDAVAFGQVRAMIGLDEVITAITGAAPIPPTILEWFEAIGVPLSEIYGMSESSGPMTWSPERNKPGFVGRPIPGCEVAIADDGEVICRGGNVFQGYFEQPEKTAETVVDGWLHTGDIGELDDEGYLRIVDRKKELIITSGGKNISPANLEAALKLIPLVGQAAAIGDNRKFVSALLVLDAESCTVWAVARGKPESTAVELAADPDVIAEVQAGVDEINLQFAQVEQIKKFVLLGEEWLPDSDVLTPTSKHKRRGINARYATEIEAMYSDD
ncbi:MAG: AMP-dependent synthetase/ligase [Ilumatobacteraceae bacterium]